MDRNAVALMLTVAARLGIDFGSHMRQHHRFKLSLVSSLLTLFAVFIRMRSDW